MSLMEEFVPTSSCSQTMDAEMEEAGVTRKKKLVDAKIEAGVTPKKTRLDNIHNHQLSKLFRGIRDSIMEWLKVCLPHMATTLESGDRDFLLNCINHDLKGSDWNLETALSSEFVALFVWLLFTEVPYLLKENAVRALRYVIFASSDFENMSTTYKTFESSNATNLSIDQASVVDLLLELMFLEVKDVQKQVSCALHFSVSCQQCPGITFGDGNQYKVIQLFLSSDPQQSITLCALDVISSVDSSRRWLTKLQDFLPWKASEFLDGFLQLHDCLPRMAKDLKSSDCFLLPSYIDLYLEDLKWNLQEVLSSEHIAIFVWLLLTSVSSPIQVDAFSALRFFISECYEFSNMTTIDEVGFKTFVNDKSMNVPIEQTVVDCLLLELLCLGNTEVQKQVCCAIHFSVSCHQCLGITFGDGIQYRVIQLVGGTDTQQSINLWALRAVASIAPASKDMKKKIIETDIENEWLRNILNTTKEESIMKQACLTVASVTGEKCDDEELRMQTKEYFLPGILSWVGRTCDNFLIRASTCVVKSVTMGASAKQIKDLFDMGCLTALCDWAYELFTCDSFIICLDAIQYILRTPLPPDDPLFTTQANSYYAENFQVGLFALFSRNSDEFYDDKTVYKALTILREFRPGWITLDHDGWYEVPKSP